MSIKKPARGIGIAAMLAVLVFFTSCPNHQVTSVQDLATLHLAPGYSLLESFESDISNSSWVIGETSASIAASIDKPHSGVTSMAFNALPLGTGHSATMTRNIALSEAANLRFWIRTDIGTDVSTDFTFKLDDVAAGTWNGLGGTWMAVDRLIPAGAHRLSWTISQNANLIYEKSTNSVYLDDVSICDDRAASVSIDSGAPQELVTGGSLPYTAAALRVDKSVKADAACTWEIVPGTGSAFISQAGLLSALLAGDIGVRALCGGLASATSPVTILSANYLDLPLSYAGATYQGKAAGGTGNPQLAASLRVAVTSPKVTSFTADAFFTIHGAVTGTGASQYALISLTKNGGTPEETCYWYVRGAFALRLWLRFGPGTYTISVFPITLTTNNLNYEGDFGGWNYSNAVCSFSVTNTRQEDGRFRYPSDPLQADDLAIRNLSARLVLGTTADRDRLLAIHDYVVSTLHYDDASLFTGGRKKQDALTTLANGMGVCEGYTSFFGALARAAGFQVKAAAGTAGGGNHAWNLVSYAGSWPMLDCTWDDPGPNDSDPAHIEYDYFLVPGPGGTLGDHDWNDDRPDRNLGIAAGPSFGDAPGFGAYPPGVY